MSLRLPLPLTLANGDDGKGQGDPTSLPGPDATSSSAGWCGNVGRGLSAVPSPGACSPDVSTPADAQHTLILCQRWSTSHVC